MTAPLVILFTIFLSARMAMPTTLASSGASSAKTARLAASWPVENISLDEQRGGDAALQRAAVMADMVSGGGGEDDDRLDRQRGCRDCRSVLVWPPMISGFWPVIPLYQEGRDVQRPL